MCGIVTVIGKNSEVIAKKCIEKIKHRGEDNLQIKTFENISFAFVRLSINDQSSKANQPFFFKDYIGLINGEIYNHKTLKKENNIICKSGSDIEVALPLFDLYNKKILEFLDGFYSGVIYDQKEKSLYFLRDYIGKKPLFYATDSVNQYIVSELKALPKINHFEVIPKGISVLKNNKILLLNKHSIKKKFLKNQNLKSIMNIAVKKRIKDIREKKIGVFLSGGLDSSIIAVLLKHHCPKCKFSYYAISNPKHPDFKFIKIMQEFLKIDTTSLTMIDLPKKDDYLKILKSVVYHTESNNPSIVTNGIGSYLLSKEARKDGVQIVFTGDGADEMFMGYYQYDFIQKQEDWKKLQHKLINELELTELRRIDTTSMAHTIELRCPFLDKDIYNFINELTYDDLFGIDKLNKKILRDTFKDILPKEIINRKKVSFDVGSGIQKILVKICEERNISESDYLQTIWNEYFKETLCNVQEDSYFSSYPAFDDAIPFRGEKYKSENR